MDQVNTPTHVVILQKEHSYANAFEHILQLTALHVHHKLQNVHIWKPNSQIYREIKNIISPQAHTSATWIAILQWAQPQPMSTTNEKLINNKYHFNKGLVVFNFNYYFNVSRVFDWLLYNVPSSLTYPFTQTTQERTNTNNNRSKTRTW